MATDIEKLVVSLEASITKYERTMNKALGVTNNTMQRIEKRQQTAMQKINAGWSDMQRNIATAFAVAASARGVVTLIDTATRIENSLKVAGLAGEELTRVYDALYVSAQKNAAPLESLAQLYGRVVLVQKELGASTEDMLRFTDNVAMALRVAGTDAQGASGALLQLSQAMGSGVVRAEEFNSILEGALPIAQAAAVGLKEAGGSVAKLRQLVVDGKVSSEAFFRAFEAGAVTLEDKVASAEMTVSQQFVRLRNVLIDVAGEMNDGTDASKLLGEGIANLADIVRQMADGINAAIGPLQTMIGQLDGGIGTARAFANELARISGLEGIGAAVATGINDLQIPGLTAGSSAHTRVLSQTFELLANTPEDQALADALSGKALPEPLKVVVESDKPKQISLADYPLSGNGGGKGSKSPGDRFAESLADYQRRIDMLNQETALMSTLSPLLNDYGYAKERLKAIQELENAARRAGIELGPAQRQEIEDLATAYATATSEAERLAEAQKLTVENFEALRDGARDALETIIDGFIEGKEAGDIFADVLKNIGSQFLKMGLDGLFGGFGGGGGGLGSLIGGIFGGRGFATGTPNTGGIRGEPRGIVHGQEAVIPLPNGGKVPVMVQQPAQASGGDTIFNIDARGAQQGVAEEIRIALERYDRKTLPRRVNELKGNSLVVNG